MNFIKKVKCYLQPHPPLDSLNSTQANTNSQLNLRLLYAENNQRSNNNKSISRN